MIRKTTDNRVVFSTALTHHGYGMVLATNGRETAELARGPAPRLIPMNLQMPVLDGWEATHLLKAGSDPASILVIAGTAVDDLPTRFREAGFCAHIRKPVPPQNLLRTVEFCLERVAEDTPWIGLPWPRVARPPAQR